MILSKAPIVNLKTHEDLHSNHRLTILELKNLKITVYPPPKKAEELSKNKLARIPEIFSPKSNTKQDIGKEIETLTTLVDKATHIYVSHKKTNNRKSSR